MIVCLECGKRSKDNHSNSQHIRFSHKTSISDYKDKHGIPTIKKCTCCGKKISLSNVYDFCEVCYHKSKDRKLVASKIVSSRRDFNGRNNPNYKGLILKKCSCGSSFSVVKAREHTAKFCSRNCKHRYSVSLSKVTIYKGIKFKSRWEAVFAKKLDEMNISWEYEPTQIKTPYGWYVPDFFVVAWGCLVEVKGFFRDDAKKKFDFASNIEKIKLITLEWFVQNGFKYSPKKGLYVNKPGDYI